MTVLASDDVERTRARPLRPWIDALRPSWRRARPTLLVALPILFGCLTLVSLALAFRAVATNHTIRQLKANQDIAVSTSAAPEALMARIEFLLGHDRVDEVQPYVEALDKTGDDTIRAAAHYDLANGRLRQGFDEITADRLDKAGPFVVLSRQEYRRALTLAPEHWDAKFNLDVASRLVRDFPAFERTMGDEVKTKKKLWTDVPGKPEGLP